MRSSAETRRLIDVALGVEAADTVIKGGKLINVFTREIYPADVYIKGERIAAVGEGDYLIGDNTEIIDASGQYVAPGFIDPHVHLESSAVTVSEFAGAVVPKGVTTIAEDPHEIANVLGIPAIELLVEEAALTPLNLLLRVPGRVPGTTAELETTGGKISLEETKELLNWEQAVCLAGDINPNLLLQKDDVQLEKITYTTHLGKSVGGQSPGLSRNALNAFIAAGPEDSHVSADAAEVLDIVRHGLRALITHRPMLFGDDDYPELVAMLKETQIDTRMLVFCTDDIHPDIIANHGHLDERLRLAVAAGLDPATAIQMATLNAAEYLRIDRDYGSISAGKYADIQILDNLSSFHPDKVLARGKVVAEQGRLIDQPEPFPYPDWAKNTIHLAEAVSAASFQICTASPAAQKVTVRALGIGMPKSEVIATLAVQDGVIMPDPQQDILSLAVLDRHQASGRIGRGFISGTGIVRGAFASTVSHDAHNIFVAGTNHDDMALAVNALAQIGGGHVAVLNGKVLSQVALPIAGLMAEEPFETMARRFSDFSDVLHQELGCGIQPQPLYDLNFVCLPNLPHMAITDRGFIDSDALEIVQPVIEET
jgi:adenine deaminase